jgi:hypothetical protein
MLISVNGSATPFIRVKASILGMILLKILTMKMLLLGDNKRHFTMEKFQMKQPGQYHKWIHLKSRKQ